MKKIDAEHGEGALEPGELVRPLFEGPLDVVGDVHGEIDALIALLEKLGYDRAGVHPDGRRLVFVGDLCDRGPDSPAVINLVRQLVRTGRAQCVIGNHELNLLRGEHKHGNHWFFREDSQALREKFGPCVLATEAQCKDFLAFFRELPVALERSDLRVVHAAWSPGDIAKCRDFDGDALEAHAEFEQELAASDHGRRLKAAHDEERVTHAVALASTGEPPPMLMAVGAYDEHYQLGNPIRVLTSGLERATTKPFNASDKWRFVERVRWWREYDANPAVVFGHYWRWLDPEAHAVLSKGEPNLFAGDHACGWHQNAAGRDVAFCIDYSVGARFKERKSGVRGAFQGRLAALRWPERTVVFDDGTETPTPGNGEQR